MNNDDIIYTGYRKGIGTARVWKNGHELSPGPSLKLRNHSPDGFEWGYSGSGPAQLALAILLDFTGKPVLAQKLYQDFKRDFVSGFGDDWTVVGGQISDWIAGKDQHE